MALLFCEAMGRDVSMAFFILWCGMFENSLPKRGTYGMCFRSRQRPEKGSSRIDRGQVKQAGTLIFNFEGGEL
jgi:hypothetical protein